MAISIEEARKISPKVLLGLINKAKKYIKTTDIFKDMCKENKVDVDVIDLIPIRFGDLPVSARTEKGIITLNYKMLCDGDFFNDIHYLIHEIEHQISQCYGDRPTQSASDGDYLHNKDEQSAFKRQIEFLDDQFGPEKAEEYAEHLLDHHDKDGKEKEKLKDILMEKVK